jgi:hypothetical protein
MSTRQLDVDEHIPTLSLVDGSSWYHSSHSPSYETEITFPISLALQPTVDALLAIDSEASVPNREKGGDRRVEGG